MGEKPVNKALLIAYHFPPILISSGLQRTLSLARYLPDNGWEPLVLSISPGAYPLTSDDQLKDIPSGVVVKRAFGLDSARNLSIAGRYPGLLALPDRWVSWFPAALVSGLNMIRRHKPKVIWSTYPIATAHLVGLALHRLTGTPWVADFRDSMTEEGYPHDPRQRKVYRWIERKTVEQANKLVFTAPGTLSMYQNRYPGMPLNKFAFIPNGFDEETFQKAFQSVQKNHSSPASENKALILLHSGILYASERDPTQFFQALAELKIEREINAQKLNIILRASGYEKTFRPVLKALDIEDIVLLEPGIGYADALAEMLRADGLLLFQAKNCNHQIPAKLYEYFRAGKPLLAFTDFAGDTAKLIKSVGLNSLFAIDDTASIKQAILGFMNDAEFRAASVTAEPVNRYSRRLLVKDYAKILESACC